MNRFYHNGIGGLPSNRGTEPSNYIEILYWIYLIESLAVAMAKKGTEMVVKNKKNHLSRIIVSFIMLLFAMCLTMNVLFYNSYNLYELLGKTTVIETRANSESIVADEDSHNTTLVQASFLDKTNSNNETITKNISLIFMAADIPIGISLLLFLVIVSLFFYLTFFILLPDGWTLMNQKVRLNH